MPVRGILGTDYMAVRPDFKVMRNPYGSDDIVIVPAISPDVAVFHAFRADDEGNVAFDNRQHSWLLAQAADKVIASVEEIVDHEKLVRSSRDAVVGYIHIDAVVLAPGGAHPTGSHGYYRSDKAHIREYVDAAKADGTFRAYLQRYAYANASDYLELAGFSQQEEAVR